MKGESFDLRSTIDRVRMAVSSMAAANSIKRVQNFNV